MNVELWSAIAQIVASAAVVVTVVILIFQVRSNTEAVRRQMSFERIQSTIWEVAKSESMVEIQTKIQHVDGMDPVAASLKERYKLSDEEAVRWSRYLFGVWRTLETEFTYSGGNPELQRAVKALLLSPDVRISWDQLKASRPSDFRNFVEATSRGA